ncbi:hypothetical protein GGI35DRAFT_291342, partial [Trichoderma velutinum]
PPPQVQSFPIISTITGHIARPHGSLLVTKTNRSKGEALSARQYTMSIASSITPTSPITHATLDLARAARPTEETSNNRTEARQSSDGRSHESGWSEWFDTGDDGPLEIVKNNHRYSKSSTSAVSIASSGVLSPSLMSWPSSRTDPTGSISRDSQKYHRSGVLGE